MSAVVLIQEGGRHSPSIYRRYGRLIAYAMRDVQQPCNPRASVGATTGNRDVDSG
jgi:hypothetical protein